ncbi:MAG: hypothetical protein U0M06_09620 [Clostridia bacterium]|nr:hypothetical protein [Clostridia bacterium]
MALAFIHNKRPGIAMVRMSHKHSHTTTVTPPTCTEEGYTTYTCSCGDTYQDDIVDALGHDYNEAYESNEQGHWHICKRCGEASEVDAHIPDRNEATNTDPIKCTVCGYIIQEALCSHEWGEKNLVKQETCTDSGEWERTCLFCGAVEKEEIPALGHQLSSTITKFATCSTKGEKYTWCDRCGHNYTEDIPATGAHVSTPIGAVASTCTTNGSTAGEKCAVCDTFLVEPTILPFAPHTPSEWKRSTTHHWKDCTHCGESELPGTLGECDKGGYGNIISKATCTTNEKRYKACSVCGRQYDNTSAEVPNTAFGHNPITTYKSYSNTEHTIRTICSRCSRVESVNAPHRWRGMESGKRVCTDCGYITSGEIPLG